MPISQAFLFRLKVTDGTEREQTLPGCDTAGCDFFVPGKHVSKDSTFPAMSVHR